MIEKYGSKLRNKYDVRSNVNINSWDSLDDHTSLRHLFFNVDRLKSAFEPGISWKKNRANGTEYSLPSCEEGQTKLLCLRYRFTLRWLNFYSYFHLDIVTHQGITNSSLKKNIQLTQVTILENVVWLKSDNFKCSLWISKLKNKHRASANVTDLLLWIIDL